MPWRLQKSTIARIEIEIDDLRRRVRRIVQHQRDRLGHGVAHRALERRQELLERGAARHRDVAHRAAGDDEAVGMDRIAGVGHQHDVARRGDRLREIGEALLRAQRDDDLALGIELDAEAARVIGRLRLAQARECRATPSSRGRADCAAASASLATMCGAVGRSGLPMPRSITSWPAARARAFMAFTSANT